jgi:hypothetical protein
MDVQHAETRREVALPACRDRLVLEEQHGVGEQGAVRHAVLTVGPRVGQIDTFDQRPDRGAEESDFRAFPRQGPRPRSRAGRWQGAEREFKASDVMSSDGQTHVGESVGSLRAHVIIVEIKGAWR